MKALTSIDILHRRILVFEFWACRHITPKKIVEILEKRDIKGANIKTVRRDISTLKEWLPEIVNLHENSSQVTAELLGKHQVTQQRLLNLAETADNSSAQVGALRASVDAIIAESDLRIKTGLIKSVPTQFEVKQEVGFPELREGDIARFFTTIARIGMEEEDRETSSGDDSESSIKSVDPKDSKP